MIATYAPTRFHIYETKDFFKVFEAKWNQLLDASQENIPFLRAEWLHIWWQCFGKEGKPKILVIQQGDEWIGAGAFFQGKFSHGLFRLKALQLYANGHSYRSNFLCRKDKEHEVKKHLVQFLQHELEFSDLLFLRDVPQTSILSTTCLSKEIASRVGSIEPMSSPYIVINDSWEEYWNQIKGHFRANLRRRLKKLKQLGKLEFRVFSSEKDLYRILHLGLKLEAKGWKGKSGTAILSKSATRQFYGEIAKWAGAKKWLRLFGLFLNDQLIGFDFAIEYNQRLFLLKTAYDENYARYSPGQILRLFALQWAFEAQLKEYEFLGYQMPWKANWTQNVKPHLTIFVYSDHFYSRIFYHWQEQLRPLLKHYLKRMNRVHS